MEIKEHHLSFQVREFTNHTFVVLQCHINDARHTHLIRIYLSCCHLVAYDAHIFHTLQGNIVQIHTTFRLGPVCIPTGGHSSINLDVIGIGAGIEYKVLVIA